MIVQLGSHTFNTRDIVSISEIEGTQFDINIRGEEFPRVVGQYIAYYTQAGDSTTPLGRYFDELRPDYTQEEMENLVKLIERKYRANTEKMRADLIRVWSTEVYNIGIPPIPDEVIIQEHRDYVSKNQQKEEK